MTHPTYKRNIQISFGVSLVILILSSLASYYSIKKLLESDDLVNHTTKVISQLEFIVSKLKDTETGQRGYLLTNDPVFLEPYTGSKQIVFDTIDSVQQLTSDNKSQQADFPKLIDLVNRKFKIVELTIANNEQGQRVTLGQLLEGKKHMDDIRKMVKVMVQRENLLMASRSSRLNTFVHFTPVVIVIGALIALIITFLFFKRVNRDAQEFTELQQQLVAKEIETKKQIDIIEKTARRIAKGEYDLRISEDDLRK